MEKPAILLMFIEIELSPVSDYMNNICVENISRFRNINSAGDIIFDLFNSIQLCINIRNLTIFVHFFCPTPALFYFIYTCPKSILYPNLTWYSVFINFPSFPKFHSQISRHLLLCWIYLLIYSPFYDYEMN